jgi:hypothetical protein
MITARPSTQPKDICATAKTPEKKIQTHLEASGLGQMESEEGVESLFDHDFKPNHQVHNALPFVHNSYEGRTVLPCEIEIMHMKCYRSRMKLRI